MRASNTYFVLRRITLITNTNDDLVNYVSDCHRVRFVESSITEATKKCFLRSSD